MATKRTCDCCGAEKREHELIQLAKYDQYTFRRNQPRCADDDYIPQATEIDLCQKCCIDIQHVIDAHIESRKEQA